MQKTLEKNQNIPMQNHSEVRNGGLPFNTNVAPLKKELQL